MNRKKATGVKYNAKGAETGRWSCKHPPTTALPKKFKPVIKVAAADCLDYLTKLGPKVADLAILDPPYNMGKTYDACHDAKKTADYLAWFEFRLEQVKQALRTTGSLWLVISDNLVTELDYMCRDLFRLKRRSWVIWYYTFGVHHKANFTPSHTHLLRYSMSDQFTFNPDPIRVPSARAWKYKDKRAAAQGRLPDNTWILFPEQIPEGFDPQGDVWHFSRVCGTYRERRKHSPNQLPLPLVERMILSTSKPGDVILDPFLGTGTTGVAAVRHQRHILGCDISPLCAKASLKRITDACTETE